MHIKTTGKMPSRAKRGPYDVGDPSIRPRTDDLLGKAINNKNKTKQNKQLPRHKKNKILMNKV